MLRVGAFLLYAFITSTAAAPRVNTDKIKVLMTFPGCVNLICQIQEYCDGTKLKPLRMEVEILKENESETEFITRVERRYPLNTFTIMQNTNTVGNCGQKALVCDAAFSFSYDQFMGALKTPYANITPRLVCTDKDHRLDNWA